jgi:hypothetical protein
VGFRSSLGGVWSVGQKVGDYELVAHLRDGGMASLFLAHRTGAAGFMREVAVKIVHPELASDEQFRQMFLDEALLSSRIHHPNVVQVEELGEAGGAHFLVMEFVHGCSLAQLQRALMARGRRLAPAFATRIAIQVAEGLHAAHETRDEHGRLLDVVHRDVTPENILLAYAGHVKLIDFGIAKAYGRRHRTQDGLLKGKFRYMSPEQAYGRKIDRRTDVYQLGIVLWEMLTLRRLFDAETDLDLLSQVRTPRIVPPSALVDRIAPALDAAVMSALDPNPARRPADAQTFARLLGKAVPAVHEVDGGALSGLLVAAMHEQRKRQQGTYPPELYERLEKQLPTLRGPGAADGAQAPAFKLATLEHSAPDGSERPSARPAKRAGQETEPEYRGAGQEGVGQRAVQARRRRWVRLASELRSTLHELTTSISQITAGAGRGRGFWLLVLGALGLAGALAWLTVTLRSAPPRAQVVPMLPTLPMPVTAVTPSEAPKPPLAPDSSPLVLTPVAPAREEPSAPREEPTLVPKPRQAPSASDHERRPARLAAPVTVDGTPLIPDPGF